MELPVKIAIIGCGAALENLYLKPLRRLQSKNWIDVVALVEPSPARREFAQKAFPSARLGAKAEEVLPDSGAGLTIILSPPPFHLEHTRVALNNGTHVLCEKPIADTVAAGKEMARLAQEQNKKLAVGQTRRFYPCLAEVKRWLAAGRLGRVTSYSYQEGGGYFWPVTSEAPFKRATSGGGVMLDKGVHAFDSICWLFGPAKVIEHRDDSWTSGVECASQTLLDHNGVHGRVVLAWDQDLANGCMIRGDQGDLWFPNGPMYDLYFRPKGGNWERVKAAADFPAEVDGLRRGTPRVYYECFDLQLIQVLRALRHNERVPVDGNEALIPLEIINNAYAQAQPLEQPWLPAEEQRLARQRHWRAAV